MSGPTPSPGRWWALAALLVTVAGACSNDALDALPEPPTTVSLSTTTTGPDLSSVGLNGVPGRTTTTLEVTGGGATLGGVVAAPEGAVPGATIRLERLVGDAVGAVEVQSNADGTWSAPGIRGGRYRVRAWRPPDLAMTKPQVFFLEAGEARDLALRVSRYEGIAVTSDMAPNPPEVNVPASLVVLVAERTVDAQGVVRANPVSGARVDLVGSNNWRLESSNPTLTDVNGQARWQLRCRAQGTHSLSVVVNQGITYPLEVPACAPAPPTSTTSFAPTTTTRPATTTTRRPSTTGTTS